MNRATEDTIAAISTPPGEGGIGIVRISGPQALPIGRAVFASSSGHRPGEGRRRVFHGHVLDSDGAPIDEVLLHLMRGPHSYTREDVVEINGHGGAGPLAAVLDRVLACGARLARPGEFTQRAFLNGRIDLVQAEAVIDRIQARTRASLKAAASAAGGGLSRELKAMKNELADALARVEAAVDFPDEDLPDLVDAALRARLETLHAQMERLLDTARAGRLYREGACIAIAGRPNVGKSCLFNALLRDARAIVSAQPGTTRDRIEETITLGGIPARLVDTAGLRATSDEVERIGIDIARDAVKNADVVLFVLDGSQPWMPEDTDLARELDAMGCLVWVALNKSDLAPATETPDWTRGFAGSTHLSALTGSGLPELESALAALLLGDAAPAATEHMLTRAHQRDSLRRAARAVENALAQFDASPEFLSMDLREALAAVGEITGETTPDDLLERIFSAFCIGK